jgi:hypothetical protein
MDGKLTYSTRRDALEIVVQAFFRFCLLLVYTALEGL